MRVKILFEAPTTYEISFNSKDWEYEMDQAGFDYEDVEQVGEWFERYAPNWLIEDGELVDMDCDEASTIEAYEEK